MKLKSLLMGLCISCFLLTVPACGKKGPPTIPDRRTEISGQRIEIHEKDNAKFQMLSVKLNPSVKKVDGVGVQRFT